jgi:hypothetical protein
MREKVRRGERGKVRGGDVQDFPSKLYGSKCWQQTPTGPMGQ